MKYFFKFLVLSLVLSVSQLAHSKELANRLGVGYKDQFGHNLPAIAAQYYPNSDTSLSAALGIDTQKDNSKFGFMLRVNRIVFKEANMNFYMGGGAGVITNEVNTESESGFELAAIAGSEFFFPGLESLGFSVETGVGVTSLKSSGVRFRTLADSPLRAGVIFYF